MITKAQITQRAANDSVPARTVEREETFDMVIADDALDAESFRDFNALLALVNNALKAP